MDVVMMMIIAMTMFMVLTKVTARVHPVQLMNVD